MNENVDENEEYEQAEIKHALLDPVDKYDQSKSFDYRQTSEGKNVAQKHSNKLIVVKGYAKFLLVSI